MTYTGKLRYLVKVTNGLTQYSSFRSEPILQQEICTLVENSMDHPEFEYSWVDVEIVEEIK